MGIKPLFNQPSLLPIQVPKSVSCLYLLGYGLQYHQQLTGKIVNYVNILKSVYYHL